MPLNRHGFRGCRTGSNITFVHGDTGWIVFDPLISAETAKAAYEFVTQRLGNRPVVAVVYSHSHTIITAV
jgi:alkyl sulfatase BDS1-like metallo-beta-lactamase superfamily hydrolase